MTKCDRSDDLGDVRAAYSDGVGHGHGTREPARETCKGNGSAEIPQFDT